MLKTAHLFFTRFLDLSFHPDIIKQHTTSPVFLQNKKKQVKKSRKAFFVAGIPIKPGMN